VLWRDDLDGPASVTGIVRPDPLGGTWPAERFASSTAEGLPPVFAAASNGRAVAVFHDAETAGLIDGFRVQDRHAPRGRVLPATRRLGVVRRHVRALLLTRVARPASVSAAVWRLDPATGLPVAGQAAIVRRATRRVRPGAVTIDLGTLSRRPILVRLRVCDPVAGCADYDKRAQL